MTRVLSCIFLLVACGFGLTTTGCDDVAQPCATAVETNEIEPLKFKNGVWVYLTPATSADEVALEHSGGEKTFFLDPDGHEWLLTSESGFVARDFLEDGYTTGWFMIGNMGQHFYCQAFSKPPTPPDPMLDPPARCSVYLDAGHLHYARLERTADAVACPTLAAYKQWLPRAVAHTIPFQIP